MKRFLCLVIITALLLCACSNTADVAFTVNEMPVEKDELVYYMQDNAATVAAQIEEKYSLDSTATDFWNTPLEGGTSLDILKSTAVENIVRIKIEQFEARKRGYNTALAFSKQQEEWQAQNKERKRLEAEGEVLYGPTEREFFTYFQEIYYEMQENLIKELIDEGVIVVSEQQVVAYYNDNKSQFADSFEDSRQRIYTTLIKESYDDYINSMIQQAVIKYYDMTVDSSVFQ